MVTRYMAQRATTKQWLHRDIPFLRRDDLEHALSAAGSFKATIAPDIGRQLAPDGVALFDELGTILYEVEGDEITWAGIVQRSGWSGQEWTIEAASFASYPHRVPFLSVYRGVQVDPADTLRALWRHVQSYPTGDLGVTVIGSTSVRVGTDSDEKADAAAKVYKAADAAYKAEKTEEARLKKIVAGSRKEKARLSKLATAARSDLATRKKQRTAANKQLTAAKRTKDPAKIAAAQSAVNAAQSAVDDAQNALNAAGARVNAQQKTIESQQATVDAQSKIVDGKQDARDKAQDAKSAADEKAREDGGAYKILWWDTPNCGQEIDDLAEQTPFDWTERHYFTPDGDVRHEIRVHYPRAGRFRSDLRFATGENITDVVTPESDGDRFANEVFGIGAGEGVGALRSTTAVTDGRLRTVAVVNAKNIKRKAGLDAKLRKTLTAQSNTLVISSITVKGTRQTPIGSWNLGDDILVQADLPWLGKVQIRHRIVAWSPTSDNHATLSLERSDSFLYGG